MNKTMFWFLILIAFISLNSFVDGKLPENYDPEVICSQPEDRGDCKRAIQSWFFDSNSGECIKFYYSGCGGNDNNFRSRFECERICNPPIPVVFQARNARKGQSPSSRSGILNYSGRTDTDEEETKKPFDPRVVSRAITNMASFKEPEKLAFNEPEKAVEINEDPCQQSPDSGPCNLPKKAWFYNFDLGYCLPFTYGGCHGNDNNFPSKRSCERECVQRGNFGGGTVARIPIAIQKSATKDICLEDPDPGHCSAFTKNWYFDPKSSQCKQFQYGGCEGNHNNFKTQELCEKECIGNKAKSYSSRSRLTESESCELAPDSGDCFGYYKNWYFDSLIGECREFVYTGCAGNDNNFRTLEQCEDICGQYDRPVIIESRPRDPFIYD